LRWKKKEKVILDEGIIATNLIEPCAQGTMMLGI
jgi:hypothetical protein